MNTLKIKLSIKNKLGLKLSTKDKFIFKSINKGDIVIDCGANVGIVTDLFSKREAKVYAFEPNPYAFKKLNEKFHNVSNVICKNEGVGVKDQKTKLFFHENSDKDPLYWSTGSSLLESKPNVNSNNYIETNVINLSEFINNLKSRVKILKIDIEGTECDLLDDLIEKDIIKKIDIILAETHAHKIPELIHKTNALKEKIKVNKIDNIYLNWT